MNGLQKIVQTATGFAVKNSPTILTSLAVGGVFTTAIMAINATPKALLILDERRMEEQELNEDFDDFGTMGIIKEVWKCYIPTVLMGGVTIACIIGANSINLSRNAALASVYSLSEAALKEYQSKVVETIGKNKEQKIKDEVTKERLKSNPVRDTEIIFTGRGETLCYDMLSGRYFKSDIEKIRKALNELSRDMLSDMFITLNEVYYALGLPNIKIGDFLGWDVQNGLLNPEFSSHLTENDVPCLVLDFGTLPRYYYSD